MRWKDAHMGHVMTIHAHPALFSALALSLHRAERLEYIGPILMSTMHYAMTYLIPFTRLNTFFGFYVRIS